MIRHFFAGALLAGLSVAAVGCAVDTTETEQTGNAVDALSLRLRDWDHQAQANLACNTDVKGTFTAASNQHYYSFPGAAGKTTSFNLTGEWPASLGAIVLVSDTNYRVFAWRSVSFGSKVSVDAKFAADGKYFVFAAPLRTYHGAKPLPYALNAACAGCVQNSDCGGGEQCISGTCTARPLCVQVTTPSGKYAVKNFSAGEWQAANDWGTKTAEGGAWGISLATCREVGENIACTQQYDPVCAVSTAWDSARTIGNACGLRPAVLVEAGDFGEVAAISTKGECAAPGQPRCGTYSLTSDNGQSAAYYAKNWNSDFEANAWISLVPSAWNPRVLAGACNAFTACTREYMPVCGNVKSDPDRTFSNRCGLESAVRVDAGSAGWSKGRYTVGACAN